MQRRLTREGNGEVDGRSDPGPHRVAWTVKWLLQSESIAAFLGAPKTDVYVLEDDAARAIEILERTDLWRASTWDAEV